MNPDIYLQNPESTYKKENERVALVETEERTQSSGCPFKLLALYKAPEQQNRTKQHLTYMAKFLLWSKEILKIEISIKINKKLDKAEAEEK